MEILPETRDAIIGLLKERYGESRTSKRRFGLKQEDIAEEIFTSSSALSQALNGKCDENMGQRILRRIQLKKHVLEQEKKIRRFITKIVIVSIIAVLLASYTILNFINSSNERQYPSFTHFFDDADLLPFLDEAPDTLKKNYNPEYKFEGKWKLDETRKYAFPMKHHNDDLYYKAQSADIRMWHSTLDMEHKKTFFTLEFLENEIWYSNSLSDTKEKYNNEWTNKASAELAIEIDENKDNFFERLATVNSLFISKITIKEDSISRTGEHLGRYITNINDKLSRSTGYSKSDIIGMLQDNVGSMRKTSSAFSHLSFLNNKFIRDSLKTKGLSFNSLFPISEFDTPYTKTYILVDPHNEVDY